MNRKQELKLLWYSVQSTLCFNHLLWDFLYIEGGLTFDHLRGGSHLQCMALYIPTNQNPKPNRKTKKRNTKKNKNTKTPKNAKKHQETPGNTTNNYQFTAKHQTPRGRSSPRSSDERSPSWPAALGAAPRPRSGPGAAAGPRCGLSARTREGCLRGSWGFLVEKRGPWKVSRTRGVLKWGKQTTSWVCRVDFPEAPKTVSDKELRVAFGSHPIPLSK